MSIETLADWGEFRLLNEIVLPALEDTSLFPLGDDCAYVQIPESGRSLVITSDAAPKPLVWNLGHRSFWTWGWYALLINISDLAAAGAKPLAFTSSVEAPSSMLIDDFREFFSGMATACREFAISNAGGNIRTAPRFECHGTAIGTVKKGKLLTRGGCHPGDVIAVIGECGRFISAYLQARTSGISCLSEDDKVRLLQPRPQIREMAFLQNAGVLHASSDNSDGLLGALWNIAERSKCQIEIDMRDELIPDGVRSIARIEGLDPWNLMFCWGDWQVVVAIAADILSHFETLASQEGIRYMLLGRAVDGQPVLYGVHSGHRTRLNLLRNENFVGAAYNENIEDHIKYMLYSPLFLEEIV